MRSLYYNSGTGTLIDYAIVEYVHVGETFNTSPMQHLLFFMA